MRNKPITAISQVVTVKCFSCKEPAVSLVSWSNQHDIPYCEGCADDVIGQLLGEGRSPTYKTVGDSSQTIYHP